VAQPGAADVERDARHEHEVHAGRVQRLTRAAAAAAAAAAAGGRGVHLARGGDAPPVERQPRDLVKACQAHEGHVAAARPRHARHVHARAALERGAQRGQRLHLVRHGQERRHRARALEPRRRRQLRAQLRALARHGGGRPRAQAGVHLAPQRALGGGGRRGGFARGHPAEASELGERR
jgi:hypothetical protein